MFYISESSILTKETGVNKNLKIQGNAEDKGLTPPPINNSQKHLSTNGHLWRMLDFKTFDNVSSILRDDLKAEIKQNSSVSIAAAYFSIYAFAELKKELENIEELRFTGDEE